MGVVFMRSRSWHSQAVVVALLAIQLGVSALGVIGMCVDRPHTHGGTPAPDCLMHMSQPASTAPETSNHSHHHHDSNTPSSTAQLACSCSSDPLTLMTTEIAAIPIGVSVDLPDLIALSSLDRAQSAPEDRPTPLAPPPRSSLS